jgi:hypothetical protein
LRPGTSYRVSVRARPLGGGLGVDDGAPEGTRGWAGWCTSLDVQTAATASNPAPLIESPAEGEEVTLGEALEIRWTGPQVRCPSVAPSPWCQWQRVVAWAALTRGLVCAQRVLGAYVCNHTGLCHRTLERGHRYLYAELGWAAVGGQVRATPSLLRASRDLTGAWLAVRSHSSTRAMARRPPAKVCFST